VEFAEALFYFYARIDNVRTPLALVSVLSRPDMNLFKESWWTVWSVTEQHDDGLRVVDVKSIQSVVAVIPHNHHCNEDESDERFFIWEYMGLEMQLLSGALDGEEDDLDRDLDGVN